MLGGGGAGGRSAGAWCSSDLLGREGLWAYQVLGSWGLRKFQGPWASSKRYIVSGLLKAVQGLW